MTVAFCLSQELREWRDLQSQKCDNRLASGIWKSALHISKSTQVGQ